MLIKSHLDSWYEVHDQQGETVVDLGSGAGFDVFLAAKKVGVTGKVFGIDMNKVSVEPFSQEEISS